MFIAALLTIVKTQKQPKSLSMYMAHTYHGIMFSHKKNEKIK